MDLFMVKVFLIRALVLASLAKNLEVEAALSPARNLRRT